MVLVPFQGRIVSQCQAGLLELERRGYTVRRIEGYSAIDQARNQLSSDALADGFDETMWIDSDVGFDPNDVDKLRQHGLPVSCEICPKKGKRELAVHILPGTAKIQFGVHGGLHELLYGGTGFLHVRRHVHSSLAHWRLRLQLGRRRNRPPAIRGLSFSAQQAVDGRHLYLARSRLRCSDSTGFYVLCF